MRLGYAIHMAKLDFLRPQVKVVLEYIESVPHAVNHKSEVNRSKSIFQRMCLTTNLT